MSKKNKPDFSLFRDSLEDTGDKAIFGLSPNFPRLMEIDIDRIDSRLDQPRKYFDDKKLDELVESINRVGLLQPILVKKEMNDRFIIVAGERRLRACRRAGWTSIFGIVTSGSVDEVSLIENIQRQDLTPFEEAVAVAKLINEHGYTQDQLGQIIGVSQSGVSHLLAVNELSDLIKEEYLSIGEKPSKSILIEIASVKDESKQIDLWRKYRDGSLTVRMLRAEKQKAIDFDKETKDSTSEKRYPPVTAKRLRGQIKKLAEVIGNVERGVYEIDMSTVERLQDLERQIRTLLDKIGGSN